MKYWMLVLMILSGQWISAQKWQSQLIWEDISGSLKYAPCADGFFIPDFSHAGYLGGGITLPEVEVVKTISPISGDNTAHIQSAINEIAARTPDMNGLRGAILLKAGKYDVYGTLRVTASGIVLRGEGEGADSLSNTIIFARGNTPHQRDVLIMGNSSKSNWNTQITGTKSNITADMVPVGAYTFPVEDASLYNVGHQVIIYHPCTAEWLEAVNYGGVNDPLEKWKVNQLPIVFNRYITKIEGNELTVDAPIFYSLNKSLSQSYVYRHNMAGTVYNVGIENLRIAIETLGGTDENHAWQAVRFKSCENAWALNCTFTSFGQSAIITEATTRSTFKNCKAIDPVAIVTGERMYNFNTYHFSQLNLFADNYARNGRHHYTSNGTSTTSGNVFLRCISDGVQSVNEGHRQWTSGMLYDNHLEQNLRREFVLGLYNRVDAGTGHGWSAAHSVLWNCDVTSGGVIGLQKPPTSQNYAIGCIAKRITGIPISTSDFPIGYTEGTNQPGLYPESLYEAQLKDRIGESNRVPGVKENQKILFFFDRQNNAIRFTGELNFLQDDSELSLYDISGRLILIHSITHINETVYLNNTLKTGIYFLKLKGAQKPYSQKIFLD
jgi:hypothetical protein